MDQYLAEGYTYFQLKVGRNSSVEADIARIRTAGAHIKPGEYLVADANRAWKTHEAIRVLRPPMLWKSPVWVLIRIFLFLENRCRNIVKPIVLGIPIILRNHQ